MGILTEIENLAHKEKISKRDFPKIDTIISHLGHLRKDGTLTTDDITKINASFGKEFLENTVQGYGLRKPCGYPGDYLMIDKIYTHHKSAIEKYELWDEYFHLQSAPVAVRNRKEYFKKVMMQKSEISHEIRLLNVASGPARDLLELYANLNQENVLKTTCIDMDENAIMYAKKLNSKYLDKIKFIQKNIFRHRDENQYDVIWSAGLFDYFNDKAFILVLKKFKGWLKKNGEIIIGNFNETHNPSRDYMEIFGEWYLHHRTSKELINLAKEAGFEESEIKIGREPENVNLFLHIRT